MRPASLVVGIGNPLLDADAFGPAVVQQLRARSDFPSTVELVDAHSDLLNSIERFAEFDHVVVVDAFLGAGTGEVRTIEEPTFSSWSTESPDAHGVSAMLAIGLFRRLHPHARTRITLVGLDVARVSAEGSLSPDATDAGASAVMELLLSKDSVHDASNNRT